MARRRIFEGFTSKVANGIRQFFARAPEMQAQELRRGGLPMTARAGIPYSLVNQFGYDALSSYLYIDQDLQSRYIDYEDMDEYPEVECALDIYADDATVPSADTERSIWATSRDKTVSDDLNAMLHKRVLVEEDIWGHTRTLSKYGNVFGELIVNDTGVIGVNYLPPPTMRRIEDPRGVLLGFMQDIQGRFNITIEEFYRIAEMRYTNPQSERIPGLLTVFEDWEVVHWRLRGKHMRSTYGHGVIEPARQFWKRLSLLEDALLIYKLERAPSRYAFYIDVGEMDAERGLAYVNRVKNSYTRHKFVNPSTGELDMRYNPLAMDEDFFVPTRAGKRSTEIEVLQGPDYSEVETLEYHRDKLVSSLKVPKVYMGYGGEAQRNALASEDIRFARTVMRVQREERCGWRKVGRVHLIAQGKNVENIDYDIRMEVPSQILELARVEVLSAKADLAMRMKEDVGSKWVLTHIYGFSEEEAVTVMRERNSEKISTAKVDAQVQQLTMGPMEGKTPPSASTDLLEHRISKIIHAVSKEDWRKAFEGGGREAEKRADAKFERVLREHVDLRRRFNGLAGLMHDIRGSLRSSAQLSM